MSDGIPYYLIVKLILRHPLHIRLSLPDSPNSMILRRVVYWLTVRSYFDSPGNQH